MTSFYTQLTLGIKEALTEFPQSVLNGVIAGAVYATLANYPRVESIKIWTITQIVEQAFLTIASCIATPTYPRTSLSGIITLVISLTTFRIYELEKRNLLGRRMKLFLISWSIVHCIKIRSQFENLSKVKTNAV